jgi:hypothetical protein
VIGRSGGGRPLAFDGVIIRLLKGSTTMKKRHRVRPVAVVGLLVGLLLAAGIGIGATSASAEPGAKTTYALVNALRGRCLDYDPAKIQQAGSAVAQVWDCNGATQQAFAFGSNAGSQYDDQAIYALDRGRNRCLTAVLPAAGNGNGLAVEFRPCVYQSADQAWNVVRSGDVAFVSNVAATNRFGRTMVLDQNPNDGNQLYLWEQNGQPQQQWRLPTTPYLTGNCAGQPNCLS